MISPPTIIPGTSRTNRHVQSRTRARHLDVALTINLAHKSRPRLGRLFFRGPHPHLNRLNCQKPPKRFTGAQGRRFCDISAQPDQNASTKPKALIRRDRRNRYVQGIRRQTAMSDGVRQYYVNDAMRRQAI